MSEKEAVQIYYSLRQNLEVDIDNFGKPGQKALEEQYLASMIQLKGFRFAEFTISKTKMLSDVFERIMEEMKPSAKGKITLKQGIDSDYGLILKITQDVEEMLLPDANRVEISNYLRDENGIDTSDMISVLRNKLKDLKLEPPANFLALIETKEKILFALLRTLTDLPSVKPCG